MKSWIVFSASALVLMLVLGGGNLARQERSEVQPLNPALADSLLAPSNSCWSERCDSCPATLLNLTAAPSQGKAPLRVLFTANVSGGCPPFTFEWEFGDGSGGTGPSLTHWFNGSGTFPSRVTARDAHQKETDAWTTVAVTGGPGPLALAVSASPSSGPAPLRVGLWANVTGGNFTDDSSISWSFGDGGAGSGGFVRHVYGGPGTYHVTANLTREGSTLVSGRTIVAVTAGGGKGWPANLSLTASPAFGAVPLNVTVTAISNGVGAPFNLMVCFGDRPGCNLVESNWSASAPATVVHSYRAPGNFTVEGTLVAPDSSLLAGASVGVDVIPASPLVLAASGVPTSGSAPFAVSFRAAVSGGTAPYTLQWYFGDGAEGSSLAGAPAVHTYSTAGVYHPRVIVSDGGGHAASEVLSTVTVLPVAFPAGLSDLVGGIPTFDLLALVSGGALVIGVALGRQSVRSRRERRYRREGEQLVEGMKREM